MTQANHVPQRTSHPRTLGARLFGNAVTLGLILLRSALMALLLLLRSLNQ